MHMYMYMYMHMHVHMYIYAVYTAYIVRKYVYHILATGEWHGVLCGWQYSLEYMHSIYTA